MKYFFKLLFLLFLINTVAAQEKHFVFIESDTKRPFYISLNGKVYSSTASGYVIIPKLDEGEYTAIIGFAGNSFPEQSFRYVVAQKDLGYILKNFGEKGWGLIDLQTLAVTMAGETHQPSALTEIIKPKPVEEYKPEISFERKKDTVPNVPVKKEEAVVTVDANVSANKPVDSILATPINSMPLGITSQALSGALNPLTQPAEKRDSSSLTNTTVTVSSIIKKVAEVKGNMGIYLTYVDGHQNANDTIQLIIPTNDVDGTSLSKGSPDNTAIASQKNPENKSPTNTDLQFLNMELNNTKKDSINSNSTSTEKPVMLVNSNCVNSASESDYNKLRRKIASQTSEDDKMNEAKKVFKNKCFTTSQIKGLSSLFLSDESRYKFFDVSYNFVTDAEQYSSLEKELIDPYYITRFKAMLKH